MGEVEQLVKQIQNLTPRDFAEFRAWFLEFEARVWDRQIEADVKAGKLDGLVAEALATAFFGSGSGHTRTTTGSSGRPPQAEPTG